MPELYEGSPARVYLEAIEAVVQAQEGSHGAPRKPERLHHSQELGASGYALEPAALSRRTSEENVKTVERRYRPPTAVPSPESENETDEKTKENLELDRTLQRTQQEIFLNLKPEGPREILYQKLNELAKSSDQGTVSESDSSVRSKENCTTGSTVRYVPLLTASSVTGTSATETSDLEQCCKPRAISLPMLKNRVESAEPQARSWIPLLGYSGR